MKLSGYHCEVTHSLHKGFYLSVTRHFERDLVFSRDAIFDTIVKLEKGFDRINNMLGIRMGKSEQEKHIRNRNKMVKENILIEAFKKRETQAKPVMIML